MKIKWLIKETMGKKSNLLRNFFVIAVSVFVAGCSSGVPSGAPSANATNASAAGSPAPNTVAPSTPSVATIEPYGPLYTVTVDVAGAPRRFLLDTGGGMTVFTSELAAQAGCTLGGQLTGFRLSGERLEAPRCDGATVNVAGWTSRPHTVLVMDINKLLPKDWARLDGLLSLSTFDGHVLTVDLPGRRLVVDDQLPKDARALRARFERSMMGMALVAFVASRHDKTDIWLEVDTGSTSALLLNEKIAPLIGVKNPLPKSGAVVDLNLDSGAPVRTPVELEKMIFDGNIDQGTFGSWVMTFDLVKGNVWIKTQQ